MQLATRALLLTYALNRRLAYLLSYIIVFIGSLLPRYILATYNSVLRVLVYIIYIIN